MPSARSCPLWASPQSLWIWEGIARKLSRELSRPGLPFQSSTLDHNDSSTIRLPEDPSRSAVPGLPNRTRPTRRLQKLWLLFELQHGLTAHQKFSDGPKYSTRTVSVTLSIYRL